MQLIIQHLFQASTLEDVPRQRLEAFVEEYPSFGIGRYLLSRKLRTEDADSFMTEAQKTSLYFPNPFWLQWQLDNDIALDGGSAIAPAAGPVSYVPAEPQHSEPVYIAPVETPVEEITAASVSTDGTPAAADADITVAGHSAQHEQQTDHAPDNLPTAVALAEAYGGDTEESTSLPTWSRPEEPQAAEPAAAELLLKSIEEAKGLRETLQMINDDFPAAVPAEPTIEHPTVYNGAAEEPIHDEEPPFVLTEEMEEPETTELPVVMPEIVDEPAAASEPASSRAADPADQSVAFAAGSSSAAETEPAIFADAIQPEAIAMRIQEAAAVLKPEQPAAPEKQPELKPPALTAVTPTHSDSLPIFEPYHTIDYFASQGIKLSLDELSSDQLGRQLKSFTEWLKTMRRLPQKDREIIPDRVAEQTVQDIAAHSIESKEIVTETMAEVFIKQGMPDRARLVYEKLSLHNPNKRAYFASKIEQLNFH